MHTSRGTIPACNSCGSQQPALCRLRLENLHASPFHSSAARGRSFSRRGRSQHKEKTVQAIACKATASNRRPTTGRSHQRELCRGAATASPDAESFDFPVASSESNHLVEALEVAKMPEEERLRLREQFDQFDKDGCTRFISCTILHQTDKRERAMLRYICRVKHAAIRSENLMHALCQPKRMQTPLQSKPPMQSLCATLHRGDNCCRMDSTCVLVQAYKG